MLILRIKKYLNKVFALYDKEIDFYASSLSFLSIFSFVPVLLIIIYVFSRLPFFQIAIEHFSDIIVVFFPANYSQDIIKIFNDFFKIKGDIGYIILAYIVFTSFIFLKEYKIIISRIDNYTFSLKENISFYLKLVVIFPISLILFSILIFSLNIHSSVVVLLSIFLIYKLSLYQKNTIKILKASIVVSLLFYILKISFVYYFMYNDIYKTLYGGISGLFFILLWIYLSWIIYLYGVKFICFKNDFR